MGDILLGASYRPEEGDTKGGFTGVFATIANAYFQKYGDKSDILAKIAAKNHENGSVNPLAHMQKNLGFDFCNFVSEKNPYVAEPLRRTDCSMVSDGAAALIIQDFDLRHLAHCLLDNHQKSLVHLSQSNLPGNLDHHFLQC